MKATPETRTYARTLRRSLTRAETILWTRLRRRQILGMQVRRQLPIGPYIADFACPAAHLVIEVDGATHSTDAERAHDERRRVFIEAQGWSIIRFWNEEVYANEDGVIATIMDAVRAGLQR
jgi:very-short-patch-repair endonuclease